MAAVIDLPQTAGAPAVETLAAIETLLDRMVTTDLPELGPAGLTTATATVSRMKRKLDALALKLIAAADVAKAADATGQANTGAWLAGVTNTSGREAAGAARLAKALDTDCRLTGKALETGALSSEHADVITGALGKLPTDITPRDGNRSRLA